jgi:hypothetical protein
MKVPPPVIVHYLLQLLMMTLLLLLLLLLMMMMMMLVMILSHYWLLRLMWVLQMLPLPYGHLRKPRFGLALSGVGLLPSPSPPDTSRPPARKPLCAVQAVHKKHTHRL